MKWDLLGDLAASTGTAQRSPLEQSSPLAALSSEDRMDGAEGPKAGSSSLGPGLSCDSSITHRSHRPTPRTRAAQLGESHPPPALPS